MISGSVTVTVPLVAPAPAAFETVIEYVAPTCAGLIFPRAETAPVRFGAVVLGVLLQPAAMTSERKAEIARILQISDAWCLGELVIAAILFGKRRLGRRERRSMPKPEPAV